MIGRCPDTPSAEMRGNSYIAVLEVGDIDVMHTQIAARGVVVRAAPADKPWGMREMATATPEGHRNVVRRELARRSVS